MEEKITEITNETTAFNPKTLQEIEDFRIRLLGKKGSVTQLFEDFRNVDPALRKEMGKNLNALKETVLQKIIFSKENLEGQNNSQNTFSADLTMPAEEILFGAKHPLSIVRAKIISIFSRIGFVISEGPEIEDDWHNFSALNFPENHPARDMQDTFFIKKNAENDKEWALRTHTSSVQVRVMEHTKPPIRTISPGRVFRNEAISARAHCQFHQVEGLYIDENVSFADLKQTLLYFAKEMFGNDTKIRLRPSYFPFTEPSAEMDMSCNICKGKGCNICKYSGWVEILGCGMVDPAVLENCKIDSKKYSGYAFGMGIERITMLKYQVKDLRLFFENDVRFLSQFKAAN